MIKQEIKFLKRRRFGAEMEYVSPDNHGLADTLRRIGEPVRVTSYLHTDEPVEWHCKTDSSCGYEISSRVLSGIRDIKILGSVIDALKKDEARFDNRCGQHIHVETSDFSNLQRQILGMYWVKIENFVMNSERPHRRINNTYCRKANDQSFNPNQRYEPGTVWEYISGNRGAINFNNRNTTEFRFGSMTDNSEEIKNRVRFLIWFVDICKIMPAPPNLNWFTPKQVMRFMGLWSEQNDQVQKVYSPAVTSMKKWILGQFKENAPREHYTRDIESVSSMIDQVHKEEEKSKLLLEEEFEND